MVARAVRTTIAFALCTVTPSTLDIQRLTVNPFPIVFDGLPTNEQHTCPAQTLLQVPKLSRIVTETHAAAGRLPPGLRMGYLA